MTLDIHKKNNFELWIEMCFKLDNRRKHFFSIRRPMLLSGFHSVEYVDPQ